jgi:hypothetical protein
MPTANQNFTLDGRDIRVGDVVDEIPDGLDRLFHPEPPRGKGGRPKGSRNKPKEGEN